MHFYLPLSLLYHSPATRSPRSPTSAIKKHPRLPWYASKTPIIQGHELTSAETRSHDLLSLQWPAPPRNILLVKKNDTLAATDALLEFAQ